MKRYLLILYFSIVILGCKEEAVTNVSKSIIPVIEFVSINQDTFKAFEDSVVIQINYSDGDGNLGNIDADVNSVFVRDNRLTKYDEYYLKPLAPPNSSIPISGSLNVQLPPLFHLTPTPVESTRFEVYLIDRAGNKSNVIVTPFIYIVE
jgi:hypothetical protein